MLTPSSAISCAVCVIPATSPNCPYPHARCEKVRSFGRTLRSDISATTRLALAMSPTAAYADTTVLYRITPGFIFFGLD